MNAKEIDFEIDKTPMVGRTKLNLISMDQIRMKK
jgi:hypothetical protein